MKVIHHDYTPDLAAYLCAELYTTFGKWGKYKDIEYEFFNPEPEKEENDTMPWMIDPLANLEKKLQDYDVLLIHPGVDDQKKIILDYPKKFPNLSICILSASPSDYVEKNNNVTVLSFDSTARVIEYILSERDKRSSN